MRTAVALALMLAAQPAEACHWFSVWRYPWAQPKCGVAARAHAVRFAPPVTPESSETKFRSRSDSGIPLPSLEPVAGDAGDDETRARLMLRGALEERP